MRCPSADHPPSRSRRKGTRSNRAASSSTQTTVEFGGGSVYRVRRSSTFWGKLWIRALSPRPSVWPPDTFAQEDAPYLAAPDLDAYLPCTLGERVQSVQ